MVIFKLYAKRERINVLQIDKISLSVICLCVDVINIAQLIGRLCCHNCHETFRLLDSYILKFAKQYYWS